MKALRLASFILITQSLLSNVESLIASSRRSTACGFLKGKIYCFGGDVPENGLAADTSLLVLDLTVSHTTSINSEWQIITDAERADIAAGARGTAQAAVYGEGDTMVISGGFTTSTTPIIQTIAYSASSNSWRAINSFMDGVNGERQIYWGTSIYVPPQQKFYFFGGLEQNPHQDWYLDAETNTNFTNIIPGPNKTSTLVGYYRMTTLDIGYSSAWSIIPSQNGFVPSLDHYLQTVIFHPDSQTLYYFGGVYNNLSKSMDSPVESHSFAEAMTFNTVTNTWGVKAFTGDIPLKRVLHTTTLLPSNQEVLLYGGASEELAPAVSDFCYVANLQTFTWKVHSNYLTLPKNDPPARAEHSAVLVDTKLFILFGYVTDQSALTSDTVLILDISNTEKLSFVSEYAGLYGSNTSNVGAIAGGVVGGVGGLLLVAAALFFYRRKQKAKANDSSSNSVNGNEPQEPVVDWDDIESKFIAHPARQSTTFSPMITPNTMNTVIANDNKYYPPNEIELPREKTLVEKTRSLTMELSPAMTAASVSPSANTMVPPYSPGFSRQSTVLSSPDVSHATPTTIAAGSHSPNVHSRHEDELLISQGFTNITKPDVGSS